MKLAHKVFSLTASAFGAAVTVSAFAADPAPALEPFVAQYSVSWKGISAGTSELKLERQADGRYLYTSRSNARGMYKMFFSDEILQSTMAEVSSTGIRPLRYRGDDGSDKTDRDVSLDFNWSARQITGVAEDEKVQLELPAGVQDPMSIQLALMHDLHRKQAVTGYQMADKNRIKAYTYTFEGTQRINTALGPLDTVVYSSHRQDSNKRITRMWHAPSLGYIPVKAERLKEGKREVLMEIKTLERRG
jgi:hypothetical protein